MTNEIDAVNDPSVHRVCHSLLERLQHLSLSKQPAEWDHTVHALSAILAAFPLTTLETSLFDPLLQRTIAQSAVTSQQDLDPFLAKILSLTAYFDSSCLLDLLTQIEYGLINNANILYRVNLDDGTRDMALKLLKTLCQNPKLSQIVEKVPETTCSKVMQPLLNRLLTLFASFESPEIVDACLIGLLNWIPAAFSDIHADFLSALWPVVVTQSQKQPVRCLRLLCPLLDLFLSHRDTIDIFQQDLLFDIIQNSLLSDQSEAVKFASFVLKRMVDHIAQNNTTGKVSLYLKASSNTAKDAFKSAWSTFFLLFEAMQEQKPHLVEPMLPQFTDLLCQVQNGYLHASWLLLALKRGVLNDNLPISKLMTEFTLKFASDKPSLRDLFLELILLQSPPNFVFDFMMPCMRQAALFAVPNDQIDFQSPLGNAWSHFIQESIHFMHRSNQKDALSTFVRHVLKQGEASSSVLLVLYLFSGLANVSVPTKTIRASCLNTLNAMMECENSQSRWGRVQIKALLLKYVWQMMVQHADLTGSISLKSLCTFILHFVPPPHHVAAQSTFRRFLDWFQTQIDLDELMSALKLAVQNVLSDESPIDVQSLWYQQLSRTIAVLSKDKPDVLRRLNDLLLSVFQRMQGLQNKTYMTQHNKMHLMALTFHLFKEMTIWHENFDVARAFPVFLECIDDLFCFADQQFLNSRASLPLCDSLVLLQLLHLWCVGVRVNAPIKHCFDLVVTQESHMVRPPLLRNKVPAFRILDLMDSWRSRAVAYLSASDLRTKWTALGLLALCLQSEMHLTAVYHKSPLSPAQLKDLIHTVLPLTWGETAETVDALRRRFLEEKWTWFQCQAIQAMLQWKHVYGMTTLDFEGNVLGHVIDELEKACDGSAVHLYDIVLHVLHSSDHKPTWHASKVEALQRLSTNLLTSTWSHAKDYFAVFAAIVDVFFHPMLLQSVDYAPAILAVFHKLIKDSQQRTSIVPRIAYRVRLFLLDHLLIQPALQTPWMDVYSDLIINLLLYGPVRDRDKDDIKHLAFYANQIVDETYITHTINDNLAVKDFLVRVYMNDALVRMTREHGNFAFDLCERLLKHFVSIRYKFPGTPVHREMIRLWCAVLCFMHLFPSFTSAQGEQLYTLTMDCLLCEQGVDTRYYNEWMLVRLILAFPNLQERFLAALDPFGTKPQVASSLLNVACHLARTLSDDHANFLSRLAEKVVPWCTAHHFTVRLFSHLAMLSLRLYASPSLAALLSFLENNTDIQKQLRRQTNYFVAGQFDPVSDASMAFFFDVGLRHAQVPMASERIHISAFDLVHEHDRFPRLVPPTTTSCVILPSLPNVSEEASGPNQGSSDLVQKKVMPWEDMLLQDLSLQVDATQGRRKKAPCPLVVVASLVSRVPNLAGLCRTCEIFNAEALVVNDLAITKDPQFTNISVTSEHWLSMQQVTENHLTSYLLDMKQQGYALVGLEQTTRSIPLPHFQFPTKTLLLLGKEKQGIPADLLSLLDHVVEIPQLGVIRSLNVHVSAALCVWEYTKQKMAL